MNFRCTLLVLGMCVSTYCYSTNKDKVRQDKAQEKIFVEEFKDQNTGCRITYEYYKSPSGQKIMHGKYKRQWDLPKGHRSNWSGGEVITAVFVNNKLNGTVVINADKKRWKRKSEFVKGKGRKETMIAVESYVARNLKIEVKNDTITGNFNLAYGDLKYEATGKVNELGEMKGKYTVFKKNMSEETDNPKNIGVDWTILEQYLCDPDYTYKDATPIISEIKLGYPGTSKGEQIHIKIPRLRLSITPL